jgi:hypothetical protein
MSMTGQSILNAFISGRRRGRPITLEDGVHAVEVWRLGDE